MSESNFELPYAAINVDGTVLLPECDQQLSYLEDVTELRQLGGRILTAISLEKPKGLRGLQKWFTTEAISNPAMYPVKNDHGEHWKALWLERSEKQVKDGLWRSITTLQFADAGLFSKSNKDRNLVFKRIVSADNPPITLYQYDPDNEQGLVAYTGSAEELPRLAAEQERVIAAAGVHLVARIARENDIHDPFSL